jgi:hypothetical protein
MAGHFRGQDMSVTEHLWDVASQCFSFLFGVTWFYWIKLDTLKSADPVFSTSHVVVGFQLQCAKATIQVLQLSRVNTVCIIFCCTNNLNTQTLCCTRGAKLFFNHANVENYHV